MKRFLGYLYDCRYMWIWFILSGGAFVLCFALYEVELKAAVYPVLLSAVFGILFFVLGYLRREKKYKRLFQISETGGIVSESLPKPKENIRRYCLDPKKSTESRGKNGRQPEKI